eukprot:7851993-Pyramimonas_sp.AAC.1
MLDILEKHNYNLVLGNVFPFDANDWTHLNSSSPRLNAFYLKVYIALYLLYLDLSDVLLALPKSKLLLLKGTSASDFSSTTLFDSSNLPSSKPPSDPLLTPL